MARYDKRITLPLYFVFEWLKVFVNDKIRMYKKWKKLLTLTVVNIYS